MIQEQVNRILTTAAGVKFGKQIEESNEMVAELAEQRTGSSKDPINVAEAGRYAKLDEEIANDPEKKKLMEEYLETYDPNTGKFDETKKPKFYTDELMNKQMEPLELEIKRLEEQGKATEEARKALQEQNTGLLAEKESITNILKKRHSKGAKQKEALNILNGGAK